MPTPGRFDDHPFIRACRGLPHDRVPVWFMRQAGRSLPEYRAVRGEGTILDAIADPDLSTEITLQPVRRYGVDAAILYSDIVVPAHAVGFGLTVTPGVGPEVERPFRHADDLARLRPLDPETDTPYVLETVRQLVAELDVPLIGFAGAPFTVASYLIEGRPLRDYVETKRLMFDDEHLWHSPDGPPGRSRGRLARLAGRGGGRRDPAVRLVGRRPLALPVRAVRPPAFPALLTEIGATGVPCIHFGVTTGELLELIHTGRRCGRHRLAGTARPGPPPRRRGRPAGKPRPDDGDGRSRHGPRLRTRDVLDRNAGHPGHVFNLGHGVMPATDPDVLAEVVRTVHAEGTAGGSIAR
ncbi:MAG: uroporphyrinogen decarboxylase family protein [Acidimicrobiales bacterium]